MGSIEAKKGGRPSTPNRQGLYAKTAKHAEAAIDTLVELLQSTNENIRLGAAKALLDKCLPDVKAVDLTQKIEQPVSIKVITYGEQNPLYNYLNNNKSPSVDINQSNGFKSNSLEAQSMQPTELVVDMRSGYIPKLQ